MKATKTLTTSQMNWAVSKGFAVVVDPEAENPEILCGGKSYTWTPPYLNADGDVVGGVFEADA